MSTFTRDIPGFLAMKMEAERRLPQLGVYGFNASLDAGEEAHDYSMVLACYHWLGDFTHPVTLTQGCNSYWLKHRAEERIGEYVANGALILAAAMHGFHVQRITGSLNAMIGVRVGAVRSRFSLAPGLRQPIADGLRARVLERDGFRCRRCGATSDDARLVMDHVLPVAHGGQTTLDNLQTLCVPCNSGKRARLPHAHDLRGLTS